MKVKKFKKEEVKKNLKHVEGSKVILAPEQENMDEKVREKTVTQTVGEVVQLGEAAWKNDDGTDLAGAKPPVKVGDKVRFQRYGAFRLNPERTKEEESKETHELWVVEDKDLLAKEF